MSRLSIVLADTDETYLMPLELKFIEGFEDKADITVITETDYLQEYFSSPRHVDIFVINENLYTRVFEKHDIVNTFLLSEKYDDSSTGDMSIDRIYKYTSVKEIYNQVVNSAASKSLKTMNEKQGTKIITVYSPIGGIGKTTVAAGLSAALARNYKKTFYVCTEPLQTFQFLLCEKQYEQSGFDKQLISQNDYIANNISAYLKNELFDYIPPFRQALSSLNIKMNNYLHLIEQVKAAGIYDFIVVDTSLDFTEEKSKLMGLSDHVILVAGQDGSDICKLESLLYNIDCSDKEKFIFVCNKYRKDKKNMLVDDKLINRCQISEYISYSEDFGSLSLDQLSGNPSFQKIAFLFF
jgi:cellulose biosynthesis protein BcsQ